MSSCWAISKTKESSLDWFWSHCIGGNFNTRFCSKSMATKQLTPAIMGTICQPAQSSECPIRNKLTFLFSFDHFCRVQMLQGLGCDTWATFSSNDLTICPGRSPAALSISQSVEFEFTNECWCIDTWIDPQETWEVLTLTFTLQHYSHSVFTWGLA